MTGISHKDFISITLVAPYDITRHDKQILSQCSSFEPLHDKTNKMAGRPVKTQFSLGIRPVWSVFAVRMKKAWDLSYPSSAQLPISLGECPGWSESSLDAHAILLVCHEAAHFYKYFRRIQVWYYRSNIKSFGPRQANLVLIAYASSEGSGQPAHPRSLARTSAARSYKQWVKRNLQTESQIPGPSEWLGMRS